MLLHITEAGYVPQRSTRPTQTLLGLSVPMFNGYFASILEGVYEALFSKDAQLITMHTNNQYQAACSIYEK